MKELYIPAGKTVHMARLEADRIILKGVLNVDEVVKARKITGDGVLRAGHISAKSVVTSDVEAGTVTAEYVAADRMVAVELRASRCAAVGCYLEAGLVDTPKLSIRGYEVEDLKVKNLVHLPEQRGSLLGTILVSELRTAWASLQAWWEDLTSPADSKADVMDADYEAVSEEEPTVDEPDWESERQRLNRIFDLAKSRGYVLRICTPSEAQSPIAERLKAGTAHVGSGDLTVKPAA